MNTEVSGFLRSSFVRPLGLRVINCMKGRILTFYDKCKRFLVRNVPRFIQAASGRTARNVGGKKILSLLNRLPCYISVNQRKVS
jgi:hypothetical protein